MSRAERLLHAAPYAIATAALLAVSGKPYDIDDANFVRFAREVAAHPLRPFAAGAVHSNPPGQQYLLAGLAALFGESERVFHLGLLPLTLLAIWALFRLSAHFGARPAWLVPLLCSCSSVFLLSASSLMPDVAMLGLLLPALVLLFEDEARPHPLRLAGATVLFAVAWTLRFNGLPLLALGAALSLVRGNRRAWVPLAALAAAFAFWSWLSAVQLGTPQTLSPLKVAGAVGTGGGLLLNRILNASSALVLVTAIGPAVLLLAPAPGARRILELLGVLAFAATLFLPGPAAPLLGFVLLTLAWVRVRRIAWTPETAFLVLWAAAGFAVPVVYNQSAAKYLNLPQVPVLLLVVRAAAPRGGVGTDPGLARRGLAAAAISLAVAVPLLVTDVRHAVACRDLILRLGQHAAGAPHVYAAGTPWAVHVYGKQAGVTYLGGALEPDSAEARALQPGDQVIDLSWPGSLSLPRDSAALLEEAVADDAWPLRLMAGGAGYWSSDWGIPPVVVSREPWLRAWRVRILRPIR